MKTETAKEYLKEYLNNHNNEFPIVDTVVVRLQTPLVITDITFVGLLCIAYGLRPMDNNSFITCSFE